MKVIKEGIVIYIPSKGLYFRDWSLEKEPDDKNDVDSFKNSVLEYLKTKVYVP